MFYRFEIAFVLDLFTSLKQLVECDPGSAAAEDALGEDLFSIDFYSDRPSLLDQDLIHWRVC